ncbi:hypothetical protein LR48_Vigan11g030200 [Vigna angularis]|uniref:Uncharacterized protein n=1 Tax=Phaseolus angularis TaxID=3914 RepID=A0A0L9VQC7_PHAAN|nr:hypothetical protein LR48_Vigan11g030200 [Vigna angularis]
MALPLSANLQVALNALSKGGAQRWPGSKELCEVLDKLETGIKHLGDHVERCGKCEQACGTRSKNVIQVQLADVERSWASAEHRPNNKELCEVLDKLKVDIELLRGHAKQCEFDSNL